MSTASKKQILISRRSGRTDQIVLRLRPLVLLQESYDTRSAREYYVFCSSSVADILVSTNLLSASNSVGEVKWHVMCSRAIANMKSLQYQLEHTPCRQTSKRQHTVSFVVVGLSSYYRLVPWNYAISSPKKKNEWSRAKAKVGESR